jgi:hypothetical protein
MVRIPCRKSTIARERERERERERDYKKRVQALVICDRHIIRIAIIAAYASNDVFHFLSGKQQQQLLERRMADIYLYQSAALAAAVAEAKVV